VATEIVYVGPSEAVYLPAFDADVARGQTVAVPDDVAASLPRAGDELGEGRHRRAAPARLRRRRERQSPPSRASGAPPCPPRRMTSRPRRSRPMALCKSWTSWPVSWDSSDESSWGTVPRDTDPLLPDPFGVPRAGSSGSHRVEGHHRRPVVSSIQGQWAAEERRRVRVGRDWASPDRRPGAAVQARCSAVRRSRGAGPYTQTLPRLLVTSPGRA